MLALFIVQEKGLWGGGLASVVPGPPSMSSGPPPPSRKSQPTPAPMSSLPPAAVDIIVP